MKAARKIHLPYLGDTSLDVIFFVGSAVVFRIYQWRRARASQTDQQQPVLPSDPRQDYLARQAKKTNGFKDPGLYQFINTCVESKRNLRKVDDPEIARRKKVKRIRAKGQTGNNSLGLSPDKLLVERQRLRTTTVVDHIIINENDDGEKECI